MEANDKVQTAVDNLEFGEFMCVIMTAIDHMTAKTGHTLEDALEIINELMPQVNAELGPMEVG